MAAHQLSLFFRGENKAEGHSTARPGADVQGMVYEGEFISASEEQDLVNAIDGAMWRDDLKRRVQHYGWRYDYKARRVLPNMYLGPLPHWLETLASSLVVRGWFERTPDQAIVNEYLPGQGIAAHVDCLPCFGDAVASISLLSNVVMNFSNPMTNQITDQVLEARSIVVLTKSARRIWRHGISARLTDRVNGNVVPRRRRISLTFRTVNVDREIGPLSD